MKIVSLFFAISIVLGASSLLATDSTKVSQMKCGVDIAQNQETSARTSRIGIFKVWVNCEKADSNFFDRYRPPYIQFSTRGNRGWESTVEVYTSGISKALIESALSTKTPQEFNADKATWNVSASSWFHPIDADQIPAGDYYMWMTFESVGGAEPNLTSNEIAVHIDPVSPTSDTNPVRVVVEKFWKLSLGNELAAAKGLMTTVPKSFSDDRSRCGESAAVQAVSPEENIAGTEQDDDTVNAVSVGTYPWAEESVVSMSERIAEGKLSAWYFNTLSMHGDEAIVRVENVGDPKFPDFHFNDHFFLSKTDDGNWKIFMVTRDPIFHNPNFAGQNCRN